uniref:NADPH-dependent FMN and FAD-containing oxidoreductase n=1 Tax=Globisporangium ultimum (strain ATCC 200006 / CBS 805.95 / DAOM BR144) TaxID=431595 RepID=K3X4C7_GLOUD
MDFSATNGHNVAPAEAAAPPSPVAIPRLLVLYGSETGTAQDVAEYIQQMAFARRLSDTQVMAMDDFPVAKMLPQCSMVVFVASTTGDGEAPVNMRAAWRSLLRKNLSAQWLQGVQVAVFGLGDSSYAKYNAVARKLQARLVQLGATEIIERGLGDDQHAFGYFGALNPWLAKLWDAVLQQHPVPAEFRIDDSPRPIEPKYQIVFHGDEQHTLAARTSNPRDDKSTFYAAPSTALNVEQGIYMAPVVVNTRLTAEDWTQDVRHLELDISSHAAAAPGAIPYKAGAIADIYPENTWGVDEMLEYVGIPDGDRVISILAANGSPQFDFPSPTTVRDVFAKYLDILGTPRRSFFERLSLFAADLEEKEKLQEIASPEGVDLLYGYCIREKKTYGEVLSDFKSAQVPLANLLQVIPRLRPRSYSISSSPLLHPGRVHLTVAIVDFLTPYKRRRTGICSAYFQSLEPEKEQKVVSMWIKTGLFDPPSRENEMLLIGPGTGLAAMRAIIQERKVLRAQAAADATHGYTYLYFGSRHEKKDFLYGDEMRTLIQSEDLTGLHTAFSRDQDHKIYVQTRLAENKEEVFAFLMNGGYVYIAGSAKRMPNDVYEVLRDILRSVGKMPLKNAEAFMKTMIRTKRYVIESWS